MLNRPSLDELVKKADSRYALVVASAKRARILTEKNQQGVVGSSAKPVTQALEEIAAGKVKFRSRKTGLK
jgi:DNA-directed RNA polymerase subunit omega